MILFSFPFALFLLLLIAPLLLFTISTQWKQKTQMNPFLLHQLIKRPPSALRHTRLLLLLFAFIGAVLALAQPLSNPHYPKENEQTEQELIHSLMERKVHEVLLVIDTSRSMSLTDTRQGESRLELAKEIASTVLQGLKGESASLLSFTSLLTPLVPSTQDYLFTRLVLKDIHYDEGDIGGTDFVALFNSLCEQFEQKAIDKKVSIILLTDGGDTFLDEPDREDQILKALKDPYALNYQLYSIGIGSKENLPLKDITYQGKNVTAPLQDDLLKKISQKGRGKYIQAYQRTTEAIGAELLQTIQSANVLTEEYEIVRRVRGGSKTLLYDHLFQVPLLFSTFCLLGALLLDRKKFLFLIFFPLLLMGEPSKTQDPWKLAILHYNQGTSLLNQSSYDESLQEFNQVLEIKNISPVLAARTHQNRAHALYSLTEKMYENKEIDANQAHELFNRAKEMLQEGMHWQCLADQYKGKKECKEIDPELLHQIESKIQALPPIAFDQNLSTSREYEALYRLLIKNFIDLNDVKNLTSISNAPILLKAQSALEGKQIKKAKFYLRTRLYDIDALVMEKHSPEELPQEELKIVIESEERAIDQNIELQEIERQEQVQKSDKTLVSIRQQETNRLAAEFVKTVRRYQEKQYEQRGACLRSPWNQLLPLFFEGYRAALTAQQYLEKESLYAASVKQNEAMHYWQKALSAFASNDEPENRQDSSAAELMQSIVEMQTEDAKDNPQDTSKGRSEIERPW